MNYTNLQLQNKINRPGKTGVDWFIYFCLVRNYKNEPICDVGAGAGGSTFTMLDFSDDVTVVDSWNQGWTKEKVLDALLEGDSKKITFVEKDTQDLKPKYLKKFKLAHLDADKTSGAVLNTLRKFSKITEEIIVVDDYMNTVWPEVTEGVDAFIRDDMNWRKLILGNHQLVLIKKDIAVNIDYVLWHLPVIQHTNYWGLTYGEIKSQKILDSMIKNAKLKYSWHNVMSQQESYDS